MIPLYHDFSDETVLVFGGGTVGARKAARFASESRVVVVSPAFDDRLCGADAPEIDRIRAAPSPDAVGGWLDRIDPVLVVAATDRSDLNGTIETAARERGLLVNRTDRSGSREAGSVVVPATIEEPPVSVAISTGGQSPALSRYLRQQLETELENAGAMAELTGALREELKTGPVSAADRREAIRAVVRSQAVWKALHTGTANGRKEAERVMTELNMADDGGDRR